METTVSIVELLASAVGGVLVILVSTVAFFARNELRHIRGKLEELVQKNEQHTISGVEVSAQMLSLSERVTRLERKLDQ